MLKLNTLSGFGSGAAGGAGGAAYGYFGGGQTSGGYTAVGERITFATGVTVSHTDHNTAEAEGMGGCSDTTLYGYTIGGYDGAAPDLSAGYRTTFSTGVTAAHTDADQSSADGNMDGGSDGATYGYIQGGGPNDVTDRLTFSTGVNAAHTASGCPQWVYGTAFSTDIGNGYIYICGGHTGAASVLGNRLTISTSVTIAHTDADMSETCSGRQSITDNTAYAYHDVGSNNVNVDRITFSSGVAAAHTDSNLQYASHGGCGENSDGATYGYMIGGGSTNVVADRMTFSTGVFALNTDSDYTVAAGHRIGFSDGNVN